MPYTTIIWCSGVKEAVGFFSLCVIIIIVLCVVAFIVVLLSNVDKTPQYIGLISFIFACNTYGLFFFRYK